jgi:hypothetical protein
MKMWMTVLASAVWLSTGSTSSAWAQHSVGVALPATTVPAEATQFDFLVGHWELEITPKVSGLAAALHGAPKLVGSWKAWRAFDGHGITDELRVIDASGNPVSLNHTLRIFDAKTQQWLVQGLDVYRTRFVAATAAWRDGEMWVSGSNAGSGSAASDGKPVLTRTRFTDITAERFRMRQDRSSDNGATWDEAVLSVSAKRLARVAPR